MLPASDQYRPGTGTYRHGYGVASYNGACGAFKAHLMEQDEWDVNYLLDGFNPADMKSNVASS